MWLRGLLCDTFWAYTEYWKVALHHLSQKVNSYQMRWSMKLNSLMRQKLWKEEKLLLLWIYFLIINSFKWTVRFRELWDMKRKEPHHVCYCVWPIFMPCEGEKRKNHNEGTYFQMPLPRSYFFYLPFCLSQTHWNGFICNCYTSKSFKIISSKQTLKF